VGGICPLLQGERAVNIKISSKLEQKRLETESSGDSSGYDKTHFTKTDKGSSNHVNQPPVSHRSGVLQSTRHAPWLAEKDNRRRLAFCNQQSTHASTRENRRKHAFASKFCDTFEFSDKGADFLGRVSVARDWLETLRGVDVIADSPTERRISAAFSSCARRRTLSIRTRCARMQSQTKVRQNYKAFSEVSQRTDGNHRRARLLLLRKAIGIFSGEVYFMEECALTSSSTIK